MTAEPWRPPKAVVSIDAENQTGLDIERLLRQLLELDIVERRAYADWRNPCLHRLQRDLERAGFTTEQTCSDHRPRARKNTADGYMERGIRDMLRRCPDIEVVVIVSGDAYFVPIACQLRRQGITVIVAADPGHVSLDLLRVADRYLPLGRLVQPIVKLASLEQGNRYLTFSHAVQAGIKPADLAKMIHKRLVIQENVWRSHRGVRPEIRINRQAYTARIVLEAMA